MTDTTSDTLFEAIRTTPMLVAYFSTPQCNVCKVLRPKVEEMLRDYPGVDFLYVDSTSHPAVAGQHLVFAAPTIIIFMEGREMRRYSRNLAMHDLERDLEMMTAE
ncbi:MAG: thioredoxin family protein [Bacteroidetes bacterium]|nr:thioredoxin family protein [Bacteroidota bacterium]